ncbi:hypothetical protein [Paraburkholderia gardini]|uniref:hypothetical protein n=1 Tax=Paraburkholderia gardini TaxID=2823469 RepID=UPI001E4DB61F|nr:hypothetical protein [Paraburkholderia gardini]
MKISEGVRRSITDSLVTENVERAGRLEEQEFLARLTPPPSLDFWLLVGPEHVV